jgi:hypothetical protein
MRGSSLLRPPLNFFDECSEAMDAAPRRRERALGGCRGVGEDVCCALAYEVLHEQPGNAVGVEVAGCQSAFKSYQAPSGNSV